MIKNTRILNAIAITIAIGALFGVLFLRSGGHNDQGTILVEGKVIPVTVADTEILREKGLSNTPSLQSGTGKLFIFDKPGRYGFWMKDMRYPLDIVWIDSDWKVLSVTTEVSPSSYPSVFYPPSEVRHVLELNANEAKVDNILPGTQLQFQK